MKIAIVVIIIIALAAAVFTYDYLHNSTIVNVDKINKSSDALDSSDTTVNNLLVYNLSETADTNSTIPDNDKLIGSIQWEKYHLLSNGRITEMKIAGPNNVINHTFISTSIDVDVSDPENIVEIYSELSGVVIDQRRLLGPDSAPDAWGKVNGSDFFHAIMLPFDNTIHRYDYYHSVNDLTWSNIDASEVD